MEATRDCICREINYYLPFTYVFQSFLFKRFKLVLNMYY